MPAHIAVIICTWNRVDVLAETLTSLAQVRAPAGVPVDVLVVDNNSRDTTQDHLKARQADWPLGRLHALFEPRQGKQFALNRGIAYAKELGCTLIAFTDDDVFFPADWLEAVLAAMEDGPERPALAGGKTRVTWPGGEPPPWYHRNMGAIVAEVDIGDQRLCPPPPGYSPAGTNLLTRIDLFDRVGGFSETHFRHMDYEFGQRVAARGECVAYVPSVSVVAPVDPAIVTQRYFRRWSLKAGISPWKDMAPGVRHLAWVPLWLYRQMVQDALAWLVAPLRGEPPADRFLRELRLWRAWGTVASRWMSRLRPAAYPAWVEARSQKRQNVY
ncbi:MULTISPECIES: glycosyltransferase [Roseateles]|uniref:Glycosyltransferase n=1 Tax=Pelomonas caseinilytica TaxID=2906763 RepID=A0ABS8XBD8_9BURK|nr:MULTISPECIES: glycosyltransferase family A protein [unclassified Roseateles]MCE4536677.1 glycosyltransferase [Pelomonas sp. P7]HEV6966858.1 glycosyltransferase family A protein [Roseateles sp.]